MTKARQLETELDLTTEKLGIATLQLEEKEKQLSATELEMAALNRRGRFGGLQVHQEGELLEDVQLSLKHQHQLIQTSCLPARFSSALHFCPPCPPPPCCPSII